MTVPPTTAAPVTVVAVDVGASSGRVMLARIGPGTLTLAEVHRFDVSAVHLPTGLFWDALGLYREIVDGLRAAGRSLRPGERIASIGIDTWAVDYGLLGPGGDLTGGVHCYRDQRTGDAVRTVHAAVPPADLYARNGTQPLPFNTIYQVVADRPAAGTTLLLLPDLLGHWLTGAVGAEVTNASTTGLLDARTGQWDTDLATRVGIAPGLLPPLRRPGDRLGPLLPHVAGATGLPPDTPVVAVGSHDTASAVHAVPADGPDFAYLSSGTWSLVGVELAAPVLTGDSRAAAFTNERGVDGTVRYLRNVIGLWLLSECERQWGGPPTGQLVADAWREPAGPVIDVDDPRFVPPGDMPARIAAECARTGQPVPTRPAAVVRCILDSLAAAYRRAVDDAVRLSGHPVTTLHIVGGGARNAPLCQLTADATGLPTVAGPVEATALGNALVQARSLGALDGAPRDLVRATQPVERYSPRPVG